MARKKKESTLDGVKNLVSTAKKTVAQTAKTEKPKQESTFVKSAAKTIGSAAKAGKTAEKTARVKANAAITKERQVKQQAKQAESRRQQTITSAHKNAGIVAERVKVKRTVQAKQAESRRQQTITSARKNAGTVAERVKTKRAEQTKQKETKRQQTIESARKNAGIVAKRVKAVETARQVQGMAQRSDRWAVLQNAKNIAAQNSAGKKQIAQIEAQQQELHKQNAQDAAQLGLEFDADSGEWKLGQDYVQAGQAVYHAAVQPESPETTKETAERGRQIVEKPKLLPKTPQEIAAIRAANYEKGAQRALEIPSKVAGAAKVVGHNTMAGLAGIANAAYSTADFFLPDPITPKAVQDFIDEQKQKTSKIKEQVTAWDYEHGGAVGGFAGSTYQSFVEMLPQAVAALMTGGTSAAVSLGNAGGAVAKSVNKIAKSPAYWLSFAQIVGNEYERKKQDGMSDLAAAASAIISATGQAGIEMSGGVETLAKGSANGLKAVGRTALEEGREEVLQDLFSGITDAGLYTGGKKIFGTGDSDALINPHRMGSEFAAGALLGGIASGTRGLPGRVMDGVRTLPIFNQTGKATQAQTNPFVAESGFSHFSEAALMADTAQNAQPQAPAQIPQAGGQKQDVILPPVFDELGRRIDRNANPQAANQLQTAQERYEAQIDGTFDGNLPADRMIEIGETPEVLRSLGAPDLPLTMTQRVARKIAYPMGYLQGKHNLGIPALKKLPQQLSDPLAVLVSKTQPNSYVVLTQWNDTDGNPVVAAIHMNKKGVIEDINALASAYGKRNLEALLGKNHENVVYTKENKSIDQILDKGLQLPQLLSDDTLVAHSIAQGIMNVNRAGNENQDAIVPPVFDELGRRIDRNANPQAANQPQTAQERYEAQIDGTFDGSLSKAKTIELGRTPEILRSLGAPDLPLTMAQRVARKIAYPMGYLQGKHNLGIPALKKLPQQLSDPLAVLVSKTQPNSYVVLTQWNDTDGNPVVAAIHMNKKGVIEDINALASAYGKRNLEALLGKNHENVVYTKENKSIDQLLSIRLQLPEAMADDTLVAHSIAQGIMNVNQTANENQSVVLLPAFDELGRRIDRNATPEAADSQTLGQGQAVQDNQPQQSQVPKAPTMNDHIRNNRQLLAEHGVIAEVKGDEISGNRDVKISDRVMAFFESVGKRITRQGFGNVDVTDRGVKSSISHGIGPTKIAAFAAVPDVIRKGQIIDEQHDWKNRGFDTVVFGGRITIDGQLYDMGVVVKKYDNIQMPSKYYLHEVLLANEEGEATTFSTRTREGYPSEVALPSSDVSITQKDLDVNPLDMEKRKNQGSETPGFRQTRQDGVIPLPRFDAQGRRIDNNPARAEQIQQHMRDRLELDREQQVSRDADFQQRMNAAQNETIQPQIMTEEEFAQARNRLAELENSFTEADRQAVNELVHPDPEGQQVLPDHPQQVQEYHQLWENVVDHQMRQIQNERMQRQQEVQRQRADWDTRQVEQRQMRQQTEQQEAQLRHQSIEQARQSVEQDLRAVREIRDIVNDAREFGMNMARHYPADRSAAGLEPALAERYTSSADVAVQNATSEGAHALRTTLRRLRDKLHMTPAEVRAAMEYASGRKVEHLTDPNAHLRVSAYAEVLAEYNQVMRPTYDYWEQTQQARWKAADEFAQHSAEWTDVKRGVALDARTPERVLHKVCGKQADAMIESYIEPVHRHEAQKIKWINERMRQLEKVIKGTSRETGVYTHMKNRADWMERRGRDASQIRVKMAEYAQKHKSKIDFDRVAAIEQGCIEMTRAIYPEISEAYIANGYDALEFLENYIPSNGVIHEGGAIAKFLRGIGVETMADELPTEISGTTADRRPGRTYFAAANQRTGYVTEFDLFKAMQNYIVQSADVIFHTGDIQNLRALEERIRYQYSDEATRADLDIADFEYKWDVDKRIQAKSSIWESTFGNLPHFPTWVREYTNLLVGKKLIGDRTTEHDIGRGFFRTINDVEAVAARSMLGGNVSTAISNFIALGQGSAELRTRSIIRAMYDYGYDQIKGDTAFRDDSAFLTRRGGVEAAYKTKGQRVNDALFLGMEAVDDISSNVLTRARYYDNMARGMDKTAAMREADAWAASLMGDRSKGSAPLLFQSKSLVKKLVTMFQLEPTNTLGHVFEDMPYEARQKGAVWLGKTLAKLAIMSFLMNDLWEKTTGRRPVQDPVGIINEFVGKITGWCMPNTFDLLGWAMTGERDKEELADLFRTQKQDTGDAIIQTMEDASGYIPIVGGLASSAVGAKTSRFPMESIIPNVKEIVGTLNHSGTPESRRATRLEELSKPMIGLIPGGSQMRKTYKGAKMLLEGGQYGFSPQGERILKFPAYGQKPGAAEKAFTASQALLFGPTATARGQKYVRSGFMSLSADKTQIYERLVSGGMDGGKAFDTLLKMSGKMAENYENLVTKGEIDEDAARKAVWAVEKAEAKKGSGLSNKQAKREAIMALDLDWMEKSIVDKWLIGGGESGGSDYDSSRYSSKEIFEVTNYVKKNRVQDALRMVREYALDTRQAKKYAEIYDETNGEFYNPETKKRETISKAGRLKTVLDQINSADDLDDEQKEGVKKILLLPELGEKYVSDKAESYIGGIRVDQLIDAENAYQTISDEVKADQTIHEKNRSEMTRVRFTQYLESTGMTRAQQDGLYYFRANGMTDLSKPWSEIIRLGDDNVQAAAPGLEMSSMSAEQYKVVKAGMDRIYADKDSKGEPIDGSKKKKLIAYLSQWDLTDEQKDLLMRADGYKYGMGEKPKSSGRGRSSSSGKNGRKSGGGSKSGSAASGMMSGWQTMK